MAKTMTSDSNWILRETEFRPEFSRKYESIFCQGNGYMGVRAATEEEYEKTVRYTLVAGTFDKMERKNTTELPNSADTTAVYLSVDGIGLELTEENTANYTRTLDLRTGLLERSFLWTPREGVQLQFYSQRFVSLVDRHLLGQRVRVKVLQGKTALELFTGIRGGERYGDPHFLDMESRLEGDILQYAETTHESGITFVTGSFVSARCNGAALRVNHHLYPDRIVSGCSLTLEEGDELTVDKLSRLATTRDNDFSCDRDEWEREALLRREKGEMQRLKKESFDALLAASAAAWEQLWEGKDIAITGDADADLLAYRFAVYHLTIMSPIHDNRMNIGAKGLSGKGYFGHTFWDTEVYMLPFFIWTDPKGARSLLEYRYNCLEAARQNARNYGYRGARFPWEAAWITDAETCPEDHFSKHEVHVTADVAYGVYSYYQVTHDMDFMLRYGCELLFETATFWASRLEYNAVKDCYEILDVIGPDEFTHNANNNAFTNYLAHLNLTLAAQWQQRLKAHFPREYARLSASLGLEGKSAAWQTMADKLVLPVAGEDNILPQDDDFMTLPEIDLTIYRAGEKKLRKDYPYPTYTRLKVSKQADVMNLFLLREDLFHREVKKASLAYYEPYCVHESSLSLCAYSMLAADCGEMDAACALFERARAIDLGPNMKSSDDGIHAASLGGIWQCCVLGFCGVRLCGEHLRIEPNLPPHWQSVTAKIWWRGSLLEVTATHHEAAVQVLKGDRDLEILSSKGLLMGKQCLTWEL